MCGEARRGHENERELSEEKKLQDKITSQILIRARTSKKIRTDWHLKT